MIKKEFYVLKGINRASKMKSVFCAIINLYNYSRAVLRNATCLNILAFIIFSIVAFPTSAQESDELNNWSIETSLTFAPAAQIYMLKASYQLSEKSELGFGPAFQNWKNTDKEPMGQANAYTLLLSYRYFFYKNFHVELEFWPAYNHFDSFVDGKTYKGLELWVEYKVGYKVGITNNLYINIQPGLAHGLWMQNKWPEFKDYTTMELIKNSLVFVPQILVGWTF
jgi:hypothetical protein